MSLYCWHQTDHVELSTAQIYPCAGLYWHAIAHSFSVGWLPAERVCPGDHLPLSVLPLSYLLTLPTLNRYQWRGNGFIHHQMPCYNGHTLALPVDAQKPLRLFSKWHLHIIFSYFQHYPNTIFCIKVFIVVPCLFPQGQRGTEISNPWNLGAYWAWLSKSPSLPSCVFFYTPQLMSNWFISCQTDQLIISPISLLLGN